MTGAARMEQRHRRPEKGMAGATWQETQIYAKPRLFTARRAPYNKSTDTGRALRAAVQGGCSMQYGHFDNDRREYVIDRVDLPASWTIILARRRCAPW